MGVTASKGNKEVVDLALTSKTTMLIPTPIMQVTLASITVTIMQIWGLRTEITTTMVISPTGVI